MAVPPRLSLTDQAPRHTVVDRRPSYLCFPDVVRVRRPQGWRLVAVYTETDCHIKHTYKRLVCAVSEDGGISWSAPRILHPTLGHCPRIAAMPGGLPELLVHDDRAGHFASLDGGDTWSHYPAKGFVHTMPDRPLHIEGDAFLTLGHSTMGAAPYPPIGQRLVDAFCYRSTDRCHSWEKLSVQNRTACLALCEGSMCRLPDGRVLALFRENSQVGEPCYAVVSEDQGQTWGEPLPAPFVGHRPCAGVTADGRILVTFRDRGPDGGTAAWLGDLEELLDGPYPAPSLMEDRVVATLAPGGLVIEAPGGAPKTAPEGRAWLQLRPLSDPAHAQAELAVELEVKEGGFGLRLGAWFTVGPKSITPVLEGARPLKLTPGPHRITLSYDQGAVTVRVDGKKRKTYELEPAGVRRRPVLLGSSPSSHEPSEDEPSPGFRVVLRRIRHATHEPRLGRRHAYDWDARETPGLMPDAYQRGRILELANDRRALWPDYGYSGWCETGDGGFVCLYHHAAGHEPGYTPYYSSHIRATRFSPNDFPHTKP